MKRLFWISFCLMFSFTSTTHAAWKRHTIDSSSQGADGVRVGDINRDGQFDLVTGWEEGGIVRIYINPGPNHSKMPWPRVTVGRVASPEDAVFADVDQDGHLDVVSSCEGNNKTVYVHFAPKVPGDLLKEDRWETEPFPQTRAHEAWMFCLPLDVDGRNGLDLVIGSKGSNASISWLEAPAFERRDLSKWKLHRIYDATWIMSLIEIDMDADGDPDIVFSDRKPPGSGVKWIENLRDGGQFSTPWPVHIIGGSAQEVMFIDVLHGASLGEYRVAAAIKPNLLIGWGTEDEGWREVGRYALSANFGGAKAPRIGDINLDGQPDVVFTAEAALEGKLGVVWLERDTAGETVEHDISGPAGIKFDRIELLDLDDDGDLDVITCEERDNLGVIWYENPTQ